MSVAERPAPKLSHIGALDGIRAIAVLLVFIGHAKLVKSFPAGFGVTIFFFLSGFLITSLMRIEFLNTRTVNLKNFYIRRILRIQPPFLIAFATTLLLIKSGILNVQLQSIQVLGQLLLVTNYFPTYGQDGGLPIPLWSLAVEEHFYIFFPLAYVIMRRRIEDRSIAAILAGVCVVALVLRLINIQYLNIVEGNYYFSHTRMDSILFGCILALCANPAIDQGIWRPNVAHIALAAGAILFTFVAASPQFREGYRYTIQGLSLFVIFLWVLDRHGWTNEILANSILRRIGLLSYTIYLVHFPFLLVIHQAFPQWHPVASALLGWMASCGFAELIYRSVEAPLGRFRRRLNRAAEA